MRTLCMSCAAKMAVLLRRTAFSKASKSRHRSIRSIDTTMTGFFKRSAVLSFSFLVSWLLSRTEAFLSGSPPSQNNGINQVESFPSERATIIRCDGHNKQALSDIVNGRRKFLFQSSIVATTLLSSCIVLPPIAIATDEESVTEISTQQQAVEAAAENRSAVLGEESPASITSKGTREKDSVPIESATKEATNESHANKDASAKELASSENLTNNEKEVATTDDKTKNLQTKGTAVIAEDAKEKTAEDPPMENSTKAATNDGIADSSKLDSKPPERPSTDEKNRVTKDSTITRTEAMENLIEEEKEVIADIVKEERGEEKAFEDTNRLIEELEEQIKVEISGAKLDADTRETANNLLNTLEKEEEEIKNETKDLISKIEALKSETEAKKLDTVTSSAEAETSSPVSLEKQEILGTLKERVDEKEDLISKLKRQSEKDIDPRTGKFKSMSRRDFNSRAPADFDFLEYLKGSVANTEEFERDLGAFKEFLEKEEKSLEGEVRKVEKRFGFR